MRINLSILTRDPRHYQIATLASLLTYGLIWLDFEITVSRAALILGAALLTQYACTRVWKLPQFDPRSALISGLSLCLLLRTNSPALAAVAAAAAVASKFVFRWNGKHVFNPTNFAIVAMILLTGDVWVSPGQWGNATFFAFLMACLGGLVVNRATRSDVTYAFIAAMIVLVFGRSVWLGEPMTIPLHRLESGSLLLFTFFMISDPKTTPDSRAGRIVFAALVAIGAWYVQFRLFRTNGLMWSLALFAMTVPVIDWLLRGERYEWPRFAAHRVFLNTLFTKETCRMRRLTLIVFALAAVAWSSRALFAFCGFYVTQADTKLFNKASQVVLVRDDDRTILTMSNDFKGDPKEFAVVVPVPTVIQKSQIHVADRALVEHIDAFSAPRLVEYYDANPCQAYPLAAAAGGRGGAGGGGGRGGGGGIAPQPDSLGVTIEARYSVGEYDILILSALESNGLETWLKQNRYRIPSGASEVLSSYIRQNMKFFVAKVNLDEQSRLGYSVLRPIQVEYESPKFTLPIRLGMVNAEGPQELFVYALSRRGRVETTNYRTVKLPTGMDIPVFVKDSFPDFYKAMFSAQVRKEDMRTVFTEYAWDMGFCDPCSATPLSPDELRRLGVTWVSDSGAFAPRGRGGAGFARQQVFLTRLHLRYDNAHFPEDLVFQETSDRETYQARYVLRHAWTGGDACNAAVRYREQLPERYEREAETLARLTNWDMNDIRIRMPNAPPPRIVPSR